MLSLITSVVLAIVPANATVHCVPDAIEAVEQQGQQGGDNVDRYGDHRPGLGGGNPIPEPGTMLLFGSGAVAAGWVSRRRRKALEIEREQD